MCISTLVRCNLDNPFAKESVLRTLKEEGLRKHCGGKKGENAGNQHFLIFTHNVFYSLKNKRILSFWPQLIC